jgi:O-antigen/teichoic acid export membrane protein
MDSKQIIAKQSFNVLLTFIYTTLIGFVSTYIFTRFLDPDVFGNFTLTRTIINIVAIFAIFGLNHGLVRQGSFALGREDKERYEEIKNYTFSLSFVLGVTICFVIFTFARTIAEDLFRNPELTSFLRFCSVIVPMKLYNNLVVDLFRVNHRADVGQFLYSVVYFTLLLIFFYILTFFIESNALIISAYVGANLVYVVILFIKQRPFKVKFSFKLDKDERKELFSISLPMFFAASLNQSQKWMDTLMLGILGTGADVGLYYLGLRIAAFALMPANAINSIFVPVAGRLISKGEHKELNELYKTVTLIIFLAGSVILSMIVFLKEYIIDIFGKDYAEFGVVIIPVLFGTAIDFSVGAARRLITMSGGGKINLINSAITITLSVLFSYILIPRYGVVGAAYANTLTIALINIITVSELGIIYKLSPFSKRFVITLVVFLIGIVGFYHLSLHNIWKTVLFLLLILPFYAFVSIGKSEMEILKGLIRRKGKTKL